MRRIIAALLFCLIATQAFAQQSIEELLRSVVPPESKCQRDDQQRRVCEYDSRTDELSKGYTFTAIYASSENADIAITFYINRNLSSIDPYLPAISRYFVGLGIPRRSFDECVGQMKQAASSNEGNGEARVSNAKVILTCRENLFGTILRFWFYLQENRPPENRSF